MSFTNYTVAVDFEGLDLPLPNNYRYITRDSNGFVQGWRDRPIVTEFGMSDRKGGSGKASASGPFSINYASVI